MRDVSENSVLLVDDDPSIRDLLSMQLEEAGFKAQQAEDGIDGLVKLRDELPKVIISDPRCPACPELSSYRWCAGASPPYR